MVSATPLPISTEAWIYEKGAAMSAETLGWVFENSPYTGSKFAVHLVLGDVANSAHDYELWITLGSLARKARCSKSTAQEALYAMVEGGLLERLSEEDGEARMRSGIPTRYRFLMPETLPTSGRGGTSSAVGGVPESGTHNSIETQENEKERAIDGFEAFWRVCPKKVDKAKAKRAYLKPLKAGVLPETLLKAMEAYGESVKGSEPRFVAHPSTWLNGERWNDEVPSKGKVGAKTRIVKLVRQTENGLEEFEQAQIWDERDWSWTSVPDGQS